MTIWTPLLAPGRQKYLAIADALECDVAEGRLAAGQQLPTHRDLADVLGVTVGTITRAYAETERRGLTIGEVGRGTFVRGSDGAIYLHRWGIGGPVAPGTIDMRHSLPPELRDLERRALEAAFKSLSATATSDLLRLPGESAAARHREAGARWMRRFGLQCDSDDVLVTCGVQHGIAVSLMALLEPRDVVLAGEFTYPGVRSLASILGLRTRPVALDEEGMIPEALDRACRIEPRPRALYIVPTIQNPTCGTLSDSRRQAIAEIAVKRDLIIIEDEIHGLLPPDRPPPIASLIPDRTLCLVSPSKSIAPGLRIGFMKSPPELRGRLLTAINATIWTASPLPAEVFAFWLESGMADEILAAKREETSERHLIVDECLSDFDIQRSRFANHVWLRLPDRWSEQGFIRAAGEAGVLLPGSETFSIGRNDQVHAVRISIGLAARDRVHHGLRTIRELLETRETPSLTVV